MENKENMQHLQEVAKMLLDKVERRLKDMDPADLPPQGAKHVSSTLKDIRDLQLMKQDAETAEIRVEMAKEIEEFSS